MSAQGGKSDAGERGSAAGAMRAMAAFGAFACALAVAGGAYTMHASLTPQNHERIGVAALFLFANGLGLAALAREAGSRLQKLGLSVVLLGLLLFAGSLLCAALWGFAPTLAPFGGSLLILGWLLMTAALLQG